MIISKFNKYVSKHGKLTYIVLGIIICFAFVIFVTPSQGSGGCSGGRLSSVGEMYGKKISLEDFMLARSKTDLSIVLTMGYSLYRYEYYLNQQTLQRMMMVHEAKMGGFLKKVSDERVAAAIRGYRLFQGDKQTFDMEKFKNFKTNYLQGNHLTAEDLDETVRETLAIEDMSKSIRGKAVVTEAEVDGQIAEYTLSSMTFPLNLDGDAAPSAKEIQAYFDSHKGTIVPEKQRQALVAVFAASTVDGKLTAVTEAELTKEYENGKNGLYKGMKYEQAKAEIARSLKENKAREQAWKQAEAFEKQARSTIAKQTSQQAVETFRKLARSSKGTVIEVGYFTVGGQLPGMKGEHSMLASAIRSLDKAGSLTKVVIDGENAYSVALLKDVKPGIVPDKLNQEYTDIISNRLIEAKALAFYDAKIATYKKAAKNSRSVWELVMPEAQAIQQAKDISQAEKMARLNALQERVMDTLQSFYRPEERAFDVVAFPYAAYAKQAVVTDAQVKAAFDARKAEYEQQKKTFDDVKKEIGDELKKEAQGRLALADAQKLSESVQKAWEESKHDAAKQAQIFSVAATAIHAKVEHVVQTPQLNYMAQGVVTDRALMSAVFAATAEKPFTNAVTGSTDNAYVAVLTKQVSAYIDEAKNRMPMLVYIYKRQVSDAKTLLRAKEMASKLAKGDAAAAKAAQFKPASVKLSQKNLRTFRELYIRDMEGLFATLSKASVKQVLGPVKGGSGYVLVRLDARQLPTGEAVKTERELARQKLLAAKEQEQEQRFMEEAMARANVKKLHRIITGSN